MVLAGVVGRPHGLDGSFYVNAPRPELLGEGSTLEVGGVATTVVRRAGTDAHPIVRVAHCGDRNAAEVLRGLELTHHLAQPAALAAEEYRADELEGARVVDGDREIGVVRQLIGLPSCECLSVARAGGGSDLLVPLVRDAIRSIDVAAGVIEVDSGFLGEAGPHS